VLQAQSACSTGTLGANTAPVEEDAVEPVKNTVMETLLSWQHQEPELYGLAVWAIDTKHYNVRTTAGSKPGEKTRFLIFEGLPGREVSMEPHSDGARVRIYSKAVPLVEHMDGVYRLNDYTWVRVDDHENVHQVLTAALGR